MEEICRYEAVICGTQTAALFAGYILKKNRIRFLVIDDANTSKAAVSESIFPYELSSEMEKETQALGHSMAAQVGIEGDIFSRTEAELKRLAALLKESVAEEFASPLSGIELKKEADYVEIRFGNEIAEADVLIETENLYTAGMQALAVAEEKKKCLEAYMKQLRIKPIRFSERKLVYVTHSRSWFYARETVMKYAISQGVVPVNPFMNYGYYLNSEADKEPVVECCHELLRSASELWIFGPVSEAILTDLAVAVTEGKTIRFFSISDRISEIHQLHMEDIIFEREVHAGQIHKADLLNFVRSTLPRRKQYVQMSLFDE